MEKALEIIKQFCIDIGCSGLEPDMCQNKPYNCSIVKKALPMLSHEASKEYNNPKEGEL